jgi:transcriptional regulator with XRE-family HTH domain
MPETIVHDPGTCQASTVRFRASPVPGIREGVTDPFDIEVGKRLRLLERAVGTTGRAIARHLGISKSAWSNYITGERGLPPVHAAALKRRYGCALDWIFAGDEAGNTVNFARQLSHLARLAENLPAPSQLADQEP